MKANIGVQTGYIGRGVIYNDTRPQKIVPDEEDVTLRLGKHVIGKQQHVGRVKFSRRQKMITRLYVDNYKSLVNFEYKPEQFQLIIGENGTGKTTVFEALDKVRRIIQGEKADSVFSKLDRTKWSDYYYVLFEIEMKNGDEIIEYRLKVHISSDYISLDEEELNVNGKNLLKAKEDLEAEENSEGMITSMAPIWKAYINSGTMPFLLTHNLSALSAINYVNIKKYRDILTKSYLCKLNPPRMSSEVGRMVVRAQTDFSDFASLYVYLSQQKQGRMFELLSELREVISGFDYFSINEDFEKGKRELSVIFHQPAKEVSFFLHELSDGQRALIVLYALVFCVLEDNITLVIDEPENYIALSELQPLIVLMEQRIKDYGGQILLISHHPEFINMLVDRNHCVRFYREGNGHTRLKKFEPDSNLTAAEIVARGWEDDE